MSRDNGEHFFSLISYDILHFRRDQGRSENTKQSRAKGNHTHSLFSPPLFSSFQIVSGDFKFLCLFSCFVNIRREKHILQIILFFTNVVDFIISPIICSFFLVRILYIFTLEFPPIKGYSSSSHWYGSWSCGFLWTIIVEQM